jgi:hypothetical protein
MQKAIITHSICLAYTMLTTTLVVLERQSSLVRDSPAKEASPFADMFFHLWKKLICCVKKRPRRKMTMFYVAVRR